MLDSVVITPFRCKKEQSLLVKRSGTREKRRDEIDFFSFLTNFYNKSSFNRNERRHIFA